MKIHSPALFFSFVTLIASGISPAADKTNTLVGTDAGKAITKGKSNTAAGFQALFKDKTGSFNIAIGDGALYAKTAGNNNVAIGVDAGAKLKTGDDNIYLDHAGVAKESKTIRIGTPGTHTRTYLAGTVYGDGSGLTGVVAAAGASSRMIHAKLPHGSQTTAEYTLTTVAGEWDGWFSYTVTFKKPFSAPPAVLIQTITAENDPGQVTLRSVSASSCTFTAWGGSLNSYSFLAVGK